jgi:hypothetical protein
MPVRIWTAMLRLNLFRTRLDLLEWRQETYGLLHAAIVLFHFLVSHSDLTGIKTVKADIPVIFVI